MDGRRMRWLGERHRPPGIWIDNVLGKDDENGLSDDLLALIISPRRFQRARIHEDGPTADASWPPCGGCAHLGVP